MNKLIASVRPGLAFKRFKENLARPISDRTTERSEYERKRGTLVKLFREDEGFMKLFPSCLEKESECSLEYWTRLVDGLDRSRPDAKIMISRINEYRSILANMDRLDYEIKFFEQLGEMKYMEYKVMLTDYFQTVIKFLLQGFAFRIPNVTTMFLMNKVGKGRVLLIDHEQTAENRQQLLDEGKELYDYEKAKLYASKGIPYGGQEYIALTPHNVRLLLDFQKFFSTDMVLRVEMSKAGTVKGREVFLHDDRSKDLNTQEGFFNWNLPIIKKMYLFAKKFPEKNLIYLRNEQYKNLLYRKNNSKDRQ